MKINSSLNLVNYNVMFPPEQKQQEGSASSRVRSFSVRDLLQLPDNPAKGTTLRYLCFS